MSRWFRHYAGMMRDEKLARAAVRSRQTIERVVWVYGSILETAAEINDGGRYEFDTAEAAYFLHCDESELVDIINQLIRLGRLSEGLVAKWGDRQFVSDGAKERQRRYRERVKAGSVLQRRDDNIPKTSGDVTRDVTQTSRDGSVTAQETETEKEETPNGVSARKRASRLSETWTIPDEWLDEAVKAGLPRQRALSESERMKNWSLSSPNGAKRDWLATWRNWYKQRLEEAQRSQSPPNRKPNAVDAYQEIARIKGWTTNEPISVSGTDQDVQRIPAEPGGHHGVVVDLRRGSDGNFGPSDNRDSPAIPAQRNQAG